MFSDKKAQACRIYTTRGECLWYDNKFGSFARHWKKKFLLFLLQLVQLTHSRTDSGQIIREKDTICMQALCFITFAIYWTDHFWSRWPKFPKKALPSDPTDLCAHILLSLTPENVSYCDFLLSLLHLMQMKLVLLMQLIKSDQSS